MYLRLLKHAATAALCMIAGSSVVHAQTFTTPTAQEMTYGDPGMHAPGSTSCYAFMGVYGGTLYNTFGNVDVYLAAWTDPNPGAISEVTWQIAPNNNPAAPVYQGSYMYHDVVDLEVGAIRRYDPVTYADMTQILVAYYRLGVGHFVDIFDVVPSATNPIVFNTSMQLSNSPDYGRISMDCHSIDLGRVAIVWEYPGIGLQTIATDNNNNIWSPITDISNTNSLKGPDLAFVRGGNNINVHYVSHDPTGTKIIESVIDFNSLMSSAGTIPLNVEDVNYLSVPLRSRLEMDAPDDYDHNTDNWAYTYTDEYDLEVFVRLIDYNSTAIPTTVSVASGVLGNASLYGQYKVFSPALHYGILGSTTPGGWPSTVRHITVGWYTAYGPYDNGYTALEMTPDGTSLLSNPDYMALPNALNPFSSASPYPNLPYTGIAFSKSEIKYAPAKYLYATYYDYDAGSGTHQLHHAFHEWGNSVFKGGTKLDFSKTGAYPNPFSDVIHTSLTAAEEGTVQLQLQDLTGKIVAEQQTTVSKGTYPLQMNGLQDLVPGTYFMSTALNGKKVHVQVVIKK